MFHFQSGFLRCKSCGSLKVGSPSLSKEWNWNEDRLLKQLTHREVNLGYFEFIQQRIFQLKNGESLKVNEEGCLNQSGDLVMKFSESMRKEVGLLSEMGYAPTGAKVAFRVYWYSEAKQKEFLIMLPFIRFNLKKGL